MQKNTYKKKKDWEEYAKLPWVVASLNQRVTTIINYTDYTDLNLKGKEVFHLFKKIITTISYCYVSMSLLIKIAHD